MNTNNETNTSSKTDEKECIYMMYNNIVELFISTLELLKNVTCKKFSDANIIDFQSILDQLRNIKTPSKFEKFDYVDMKKMLEDKIDEVLFQNDENVCANCCKKSPRMKGGKYRVQFAEMPIEVTLKDVYDIEVQTSLTVVVDNFTSTHLDENYENTAGEDFVERSDSDALKIKADKDEIIVESRDGIGNLTSSDVHEEWGDQNDLNVTVIHATADSESDLEKIPSQVEKQENNDEKEESCSCEGDSSKSQSETNNTIAPQDRNTPQHISCDADCCEEQNEADVREWDNDDEQVCNVQNLLDVHEETCVQERVHSKDLQSTQRREQELCEGIVLWYNLIFWDDQVTVNNFIDT